MREDPIIYEDWEINNLQSNFVLLLTIIDYLFSLSFAILNMVIAFRNNSAFYLFLWLFIAVILFFLEILIDQKHRTIFDRILVLIGLFGIMFLSQSFYTTFLISLISIVLLVGKLIFVPLTVGVWKLTGDILVPRQDSVEMVLDEHLARLESTSYAVDMDKELQQSVRDFLLTDSRYLLYGLGITVLVALSRLILPPILHNYLILVIVLITGISLTGILLIWYIYQRRKDKEDKK